MEGRRHRFFDCQRPALRPGQLGCRFTQYSQHAIPYLLILAALCSPRPTPIASRMALAAPVKRVACFHRPCALASKA